MSRSKGTSLSEDILRIILIVLGCVFSAIVLSFSVLAMSAIQEGNQDLASRHLLVIFVVLGLSRLVTFFKERTRISFYRFVTLLVFDIALGILTMFAKDNPNLYSICAGSYCLTIILSRVFKIFENRNLRSYIFNGIIIAIATLLAIGLYIPNDYTKTADIVLLICAIVAVSAFVEVVSNASSYLKVKVLFKIILRTYALEVILGLFTMMVVASILLTLYEDTITTFPDALWYSFAVVTTIGFGDFAAQTPIGRILTVMLGVYGIIVVAVITSIIVNFYNETAGKRDSKELDEIKKEEKKK